MLRLSESTACRRTGALTALVISLVATLGLVGCMPAAATDVRVRHTLFGMHDATSSSYAADRRGRRPAVGRRRAVARHRADEGSLHLDPARRPGHRRSAGTRRGHHGGGDDPVVLRLGTDEPAAEPHAVPALRQGADEALQELPRHARHRRLPGVERGQHRHVLHGLHGQAGLDDQGHARRPQPRRQAREGRGSRHGDAPGLPAEGDVGVLPPEGRWQARLAVRRRDRPQPLPAADVRPSPRCPRRHREAAEGRQAGAPPSARARIEGDLEHRDQLRTEHRLEGGHGGGAHHSPLVRPPT